MKLRVLLLLLAGFLASETSVRVRAEDWPLWRHDAGRTASSSEPLPASLHLQWIRQYPKRVQVWDDPLNHDLMPYDKILEPVVLGTRMFIGFNDSDKVVALDIESGRELWRFYTDGPVRLPPVAWKDNVYFTSDDGYLYCVNATDGSLQWKFLGGPSTRKALGNGRVISAWPARGGPVVRDGLIYFAASIWPFMGTFVYSLDAATGKVVWVNDGTGAQYLKQPHGAPSFAGVAPQGALVATKDFLLVPGGRSVPAAFDRHTGKFLYFRIDEGGKGNGGSLVMADDTTSFVHTRQRGVRDYELKTGKKGKLAINEPVLGRQHYYTAQNHSSFEDDKVEAEAKVESARYSELKAKSELREATDLADRSAIKKANDAIKSARKKMAEAEQAMTKAKLSLATNWAGRSIQAIGRDKKVQWEIKADGTRDIIRAGNRLYAAGAKTIIAVAMPARGQPAKIVWSHPVEGQVERLLAANGKLFAVTLDGRILAYGAEKRKAVTIREQPRQLEPDPQYAALAKGLVAQAGADDGYALCFGVDDGRLLEALLAHSKLHVVAVDPDAKRIADLRRRFDATGRYGSRIAFHQGEPATFKAPPYIANLVLVGDDFAPSLADRRVLETIYQSVRPYGGTLWISAARIVPWEMLKQLGQAALPQAQFALAEGGLAVVREGPLPGAADWNHQYGNIANTVKSDDAIVKLPLGVLWFGGNSNLDVLPRHGHGPSPQVVAGRLFIQGMTCLSARDVYTGRILWKVGLPDLDTFGIYYDDTYSNSPLSTQYNQRHIPGANARGANYVATSDAVYIAMGTACRVLSPITGETLRVIEMPKIPGQTARPQWGYIGVYNDLLLGGAGFAQFSRRFGGAVGSSLPSLYDLSASAGLVAFDRHTGEVRWSVKAQHSFLHNGIVAGNQRVYCLDRLPKSAEDKLKRRGGTPPTTYRVVAFDCQTGQLLWEQQQKVFGTWLSYSQPRDLLLQAGAHATDRLKDEVGEGMAAYRGADGLLAWTNAVKYTGPCILHDDVIITTPNSYKTSSGAFNLADGSPHLIPNPLTGQKEPWHIYRTYGCNTPVASEHLMTFRSGAAGFYDLESQCGTGNFGGFKSGCSPNLIAADGVLNAPDYTRTCTCPYQNQNVAGVRPYPGGGNLDLQSVRHGSQRPPTHPASRNQLWRAR